MRAMVPSMLCVAFRSASSLTAFLEKYNMQITEASSKNDMANITIRLSLVDNDLLIILTTLELKGIIKQSAGDRYKKV